jgi:hypothetical protein
MGTIKFAGKIRHDSNVVVQPPVLPGVDLDPGFDSWYSGFRKIGVVPWDQYDAYLVSNSKDVAGFAKLKDGTTAPYYGDQTKMDGLNPVRWNLRKYCLDLDSITIHSREMATNSPGLNVYYIKRGEFALTHLVNIPWQGAGTQTYNLPARTPVVAVVIVGPTRTDYPSEVSFQGEYKDAPAVTKRIRKLLFDEVTGTNAFFWNVEAADGFSKAQNSTRFLGLHRMIRHYAEADNFQVAKGQPVFQPSNNKTGTWLADDFYQTLHNAGIIVIGCIKSSPEWKRLTWPKTLPGEPFSDPGMQHPEQIPVEWKGTLAATLAWAENPAAFADQADMGFQYTARYGGKIIQSSRLKVAPAQLDDQNRPIAANVIKTGLGYIKGITRNEWECWWRGPWAYHTSRIAAARASAEYDGDQGRLGPNMGSKNADKDVFVLSPGLAVPDAGYLMGMIDASREIRGYKANGKVDLPWDAIAYHNYANDGGAIQFGPNTKRGKAPELAGIREKMRYFCDFADAECESQDIYLDEFGYDVSEKSDQSAIRITDIVKDAQGNLQTYYIPEAGVYRYVLKDGANRVNRLLVQGQWLIRIMALGLMEGVFCQMYWHKDTQPSEFDRYTTSGIVEPDGTLRIAGKFYYQLLSLLSGYRFDSIVQDNQYIVIKLTKGASSAFMYWVPDETDRKGNVQINLPGPGTNHVLSTTDTVTIKNSVGAGLNTFLATETIAVVIC